MNKGNVAATPLKTRLRRLGRHFGFDVARYPTAEHFGPRMSLLLNAFDIAVVLDVGANRGQYGTLLRDAGYRKRIVSFEPLSEAFSQLERKARGDEQWECIRVALGDSDGSATINVAKNGVSSSFLPMLERHARAAPESRYVSTEQVEVRQLDSLFHDLARGGRVFLKIDTQGFERRVLAGAGLSLSAIEGLQLEVSLLPLYEGEMLLEEALSKVSELGYRLVAVQPGFTNQATGEMLQMDLVCFKGSPLSY